jgi:hypothetical protein
MQLQSYNQKTKDFLKFLETLHIKHAKVMMFA